MKACRLRRIWSVFWSVAAAFTSVFQLTGPASAGKSAVAATWNDGYVSIIGNYQCGFARLGHPDTKKECLIPGVPDAKEPVPAVIFLHGCLGWNNRQARVMNLFKENGYVTFSPDSFARPSRKSKCGKASRVTGLRLEEIRYAVKQIRKLSWVDQDRLVLAGFSEGGMAAARYRGNDFRAIVILAWGCGRGTINAPKSVPVLNLVGKDDKETPYGNVICSVGGRPNSKAMHVDAGHEIATDPAAYDIIGAFLKKVLK